MFTSINIEVNMAFNEKDLTKGQMRRLEALRKWAGDELANDLFEKWLAKEAAGGAIEHDPVADRLEQLLAPAAKEGLNLGRFGYTIRRSRSKNNPGVVVVTKNTE